MKEGKRIRDLFIANGVAMYGDKVVATGKDPKLMFLSLNADKAGGIRNACK